MPEGAAYSPDSGVNVGRTRPRVCLGRMGDPGKDHGSWGVEGAKRPGGIRVDPDLARAMVGPGMERGAEPGARGRRGQWQRQAQEHG